MQEFFGFLDSYAIELSGAVSAALIFLQLLEDKALRQGKQA